MILRSSRTLKYVASTVTKGYSPVIGLVRNSLTFLSNSLQIFETVLFEKLVPQSVSTTLPTLAVETPFTTISIIEAIRAASERVYSSKINVSKEPLRWRGTFNVMVPIRVFNLRSLKPFLESARSSVRSYGFAFSCSVDSAFIKEFSDSCRSFLKAPSRSFDINCRISSWFSVILIWAMVYSPLGFWFCRYYHYT